MAAGLGDEEELPPPPLVDGDDDDALPDWYTPQEPKAARMVFLVTFSALVSTKEEEQMPEVSQNPSTGQGQTAILKDVSEMTREAIRDAVLDAVREPIWGKQRGGRPRSRAQRVVKLVVFRERHKNHKFHFHVALKVAIECQWGGFSQALRERHGLASHWSTSHSQWWSAVRYGYKTTEKKRTVDKEYLVYSADGKSLSMDKEADEPWMADVRRKRREAAVRLAHEAEETSGVEKQTRTLGKDGKQPASKQVRAKSEPTFTKLDFFAMAETEGWKTPAQVLAYSKNHGSEKFKLYVAKPKKQLQDLLQQARDWIEAEEVAEKERLSDWDLVKKLANQECHCGFGVCQWWEAALEFFDRNAATLDRKALASALAGVIRFGPGKNSRVPLIVGSTNAAKSTVLNAIIDVFGFSNIVHRPGEKASMALANVMHEHKRFIYWDEYRPVEFAARGTVPVGQFLSLFSGGALEITLSQSFNNGNGECRWRRGAAMTAKEEELWVPVPAILGLMPVTSEDIRHMKTRVRQFYAKVAVTGDMADVPQCGPSFCRWVLSDAALFANGDPERPLRKLKGKALPALPASYVIPPGGQAAFSVDESKRQLSDEEKARVEQNRETALRRKLARATGTREEIPESPDTDSGCIALPLTDQQGKSQDPWAVEEEENQWLECGIDTQPTPDTTHDNTVVTGFVFV